MRIVNNTLEFAAGVQNIERDIIAEVYAARGGTITAHSFELEAFLRPIGGINRLKADERCSNNSSGK